MKSSIDNHKRVLVIRAGRLGDTVWGTTVIEPIRTFLGEDTRFDLIVTRGMRTLFTHDPRIETIFEIDHRKIPLLFSPTKLAVLRKSLQFPYDLAVNLETSSHFSSMMCLLRATQKIYASTLLTPDYRPRPDRRNMVHHISHVLSQGVPERFCHDAAPSLRPPGNIKRADLIGNDRDYLCLHPGNSLLASGKPALRSWPEEHWRELIAEISQLLPDMQIVLIGEKNEQALSQTIAAKFPEIINLVGRTSLQELMVVLAHSQVLVTTDTGPAHVAAALATPVIAVFGPSEAHGTGPYAAAHGWAVSITKDVGCNPCVNTERAKTCAYNKCMYAIYPLDVMKLIDEALLRRPEAPVIQL